MVELFVDAIKNKLKISVQYYSIEDNRILERICAPLDYGPSRRSKNKNDRFHLWDYESGGKNHVLSLNPDQIKNIILLKEEFNPAEIITWDTHKNPWFISRDWGKYS
jgi:hypothetical protein